MDVFSLSQYGQFVDSSISIEMFEQFLLGGANPCFFIAMCPSGVINSVVHVVSKLVSTEIFPRLLFVLR